MCTLNARHTHRMQRVLHSTLSARVILNLRNAQRKDASADSASEWAVTNGGGGTLVFKRPGTCKHPPSEDNTQTMVSDC